MSTVSFFIVIDLEVLASKIRQENEMKEIQIEKDAVELFLFTDDLVDFTKYSEESIKQLSGLINEFNGVAGQSVNIQLNFFTCQYKELEK